MLERHRYKHQINNITKSKCTDSYVIGADLLPWVVNKINIYVYPQKIILPQTMEITSSPFYFSIKIMPVVLLYSTEYSNVIITILWITNSEYISQSLIIQKI